MWLEIGAFVLASNDPNFQILYVVSGTFVEITELAKPPFNGNGFSRSIFSQGNFQKGQRNDKTFFVNQHDSHSRIKINNVTHETRSVSTTPSTQEALPNYTLSCTPP